MARKNRKMIEQVMDEAADEGRGGDDVMAHLSTGEIVLPLPLANDPEIRKMLEAKFKDAGANMNQYIVGHKDNSINPKTGQPEFGWLKKFAGTVIGGTVGFLLGGPVGAAAGASIGMQTDNARAATKAADEARAQQDQALQQARADAAAMQEQVARQTAAQEQAAQAAREQLAAQQRQYEEEKASMAKKAAELAAKQEADRRDMAERESARLKARIRGGRRMLLSDARLTPELGVLGGQASLAGGMAQ